MSQRFARRTSLLFVALVGVVALATPASADVIFSNFGPADSYLNVEYPASGPSSFVGRLDWAGTFNTGAGSYDNIVFEGEFDYVEGVNSLTLELRQDDGSGKPGTVLETSGVFNPGSPSLVTWTLVNTALTLNANTNYWFSARVAGDGFISWFQNNQSDTGVAFSSNGSTWTTQANNLAPVFRVLGQAAVPEPGTLTLLGAMVVVGGLRLRRARHS
jgi:hypothetical protein